MTNAYERWVHDSDGNDDQNPSAAWLVMLLCVLPLLTVTMGSF